MPSIRDVARLANASVASVSNVLNDPDRVSPALRARISDAVTELGYTPSMAARSLRKGRSGLVGLIVADITNPFFSDLFDAIERAASARGYAVLLCNSGEDFEREERHLEVLRRQRVDGIILAPTASLSRDAARLLANSGVPLVLVDRVLDGIGTDSVSLDNREAARLATSHLLGLGHRRIGMINGPTRVRTASERLAGFRDAHSAAGRMPDAALIRDASFREAEAYVAALDLLGGRTPPTAVFAANNLMTIGLIRAVSKLGRRCPDEISIVGLDDLPWAEAFTPPLTTVAQPVSTIGGSALDMILDRIDGGDAAPRRSLVVAPILISRGSCGPPPRSRRRGAAVA